MKIQKCLPLLNREIGAQECDATMPDSSNAVWLKKYFLISFEL